MRNPWALVVGWGRDFKRDQLKIALQIFVATCILCAITLPRPLWSALSLAPPISLVFALFLAPLHQGGTSLAAVFLVVGTVVGGGLSFIPTYLAMAAVQGNWADDTVVKGVVYTLSFSLIAAVLGACRWTFTITDMFFLLTSIAMVFSGSLNSYYAVENANLIFFWNSFVLSSLAAVVMLLCCWFILPVTAGSKYRSLIANALKSTRTGLSSIEDLIFSPLHPSTGRLAAATGVINLSGVDTGLEGKVAEAQASLLGARVSMFATRMLHIPVRLEIDVYNSPRIFPRDNFLLIKMCLSHTISTLAMLARPLKGGRVDLRLVQSPEVRAKLMELMRGMQELLSALAAAVDEAADWQMADAALEKIDSAWMAFLEESVIVLGGCDDADAAFGLRGLAAFFYLVGGRLRSLYIATAGAVQDPQAIPLATRRFEISPGWVKSTYVFRNPLQSSEMALQTLKSRVAADASLTENNTQKTSSLFDLHKVGSFSVVAAAAQAIGTSALRRNRQSWNMPTWLVFGLQYFAAMSIALGLTVVPIIAEKVFHNRLTDVVVTVAVVWMPSVGDVTTKSIHRILGTGFAAVWSYLLIALAFAASGATWSDHTAGKMVVAGVMMAVWAVFCCLQWLKYPQSRYMWIVAVITVPLVTLTLLWEPSPPWAAVGWRMINVCIGVVIVWVVALMVFPLSARRMSSANYAAALNNLAALMRQLPLHLRPVASNTTATTTSASTDDDDDDASVKQSNGGGDVGGATAAAAAAASTSSGDVGDDTIRTNTTDAVNANNNSGRGGNRFFISTNHQNEIPTTAPTATATPISPFTTLHAVAGTEAFRKVYFSPIHVIPVNLSYKVQRALADVHSFIPSLEGEYLPLSRPKRIPKGVTAAAAHAAQLLLDIFNITFTLKMENGPFGPWNIPPMQYSHMLAVSDAVGVALEALRDAVLGHDRRPEVVERVMRALDDVDAAVVKQIEETVAAVVVKNVELHEEEEETETENKERKPKLCNTSARGGGELPMAESLLLYLGISISDQVKVVARTAVAAFLGWDGSAMAALEARAARQGSGKAHEPEHFMAQILEGHHQLWCPEELLEEVFVDLSGSGGSNGNGGGGIAAVPFEPDIEQPASP